MNEQNPNYIESHTNDQGYFQDNSDVAAALLDKWEDADPQPSEPDRKATSEEAVDETPVDENDTQAEPEDDGSEADPEVEAQEADTEEPEETEETITVTDDSMVEINVGDEEHQVSVKDLKRLWGQEKSLTVKSQKTAALQKEASDQTNRAAAQLQKLVERAEAKAKPFKEVDMLIASQTMEAKDFAQLRKEAKEASDDLDFVKAEADTFFNELSKEQQAKQQQEAQECLKVLRNDLPDWNNALYDDIRNYAVSSGMPIEAVNSYTNPDVIKLINKARLYDQSKKTAVVKKAKAPTRVLRSKKAPPNKNDERVDKRADALKNMRTHGGGQGDDLDAVAAAIMAGWDE